MVQKRINKYWGAFQDSPRKVVGVSEDDIFIIEEKISNLVFDNCYPIINPDISIVNIDNKLVLKVKVYRGSNIPYFLKSKGKTNGTYIRVGSSMGEWIETDCG